VFFSSRIFWGLTPFGTGVHKLDKIPVSLPNFSKIRCPTAEIILVEANHRGKRKHIQPSKLSTLRVDGCKKTNTNFYKLRKCPFTGA